MVLPARQLNPHLVIPEEVESSIEIFSSVVREHHVMERLRPRDRSVT